MTQREEEADANRPLAVLHQLARHVVDSSDVVGIHGVPQPEAIGEQRGAEQDRVVPERDQRPCPCGNVCSDQDCVEAGNLQAQLVRLIVENASNRQGHGVSRVVSSITRIGGQRCSGPSLMEIHRPG